MELINPFSEVFASQLWWTFTKNTFVSESKNMSILKDFTFQRPSGLMTISGEAERDHLTDYKLRSDLKSCHNNNNLRNSCQRDGDEKIKKSVSFEEEVIVHLFDQVLIYCPLFFTVKTLSFKIYRFTYLFYYVLYFWIDVQIFIKYELFFIHQLFADGF